MSLTNTTDDMREWLDSTDLEGTMLGCILTSATRTWISGTDNPYHTSDVRKAFLYALGNFSCVQPIQEEYITLCRNILDMKYREQGDDIAKQIMRFRERISHAITYPPMEGNSFGALETKKGVDPYFKKLRPRLESILAVLDGKMRELPDAPVSESSGVAHFKRHNKKHGKARPSDVTEISEEKLTQLYNSLCAQCRFSEIECKLLHVIMHQTPGRSTSYISDRMSDLHQMKMTMMFNKIRDLIETHFGFTLFHGGVSGIVLHDLKAIYRRAGLRSPNKRSFSPRKRKNDVPSVEQKMAPPARQGVSDRTRTGDDTFDITIDSDIANDWPSIRSVQQANDFFGALLSHLHSTYWRFDAIREILGKDTGRDVPYSAFLEDQRFIDCDIELLKHQLVHINTVFRENFDHNMYCLNHDSLKRVGMNGMNTIKRVLDKKYGYTATLNMKKPPLDLISRTVGKRDSPGTILEKSDKSHPSFATATQPSDESMPSSPSEHDGSDVSGADSVPATQNKPPEERAPQHFSFNPPEKKPSVQSLIVRDEYKGLRFPRNASCVQVSRILFAYIPKNMHRFSWHTNQQLLWGYLLDRHPKDITVKDFQRKVRLVDENYPQDKSIPYRINGINMAFQKNFYFEPIQCSDAGYSLNIGAIETFIAGLPDSVYLDEEVAPTIKSPQVETPDTGDVLVDVANIDASESSGSEVTSVSADEVASYESWLQKQFLDCAQSFDSKHWPYHQIHLWEALTRKGELSMFDARKLVMKIMSKKSPSHIRHYMGNINKGFQTSYGYQPIIIDKEAELFRMDMETINRHYQTAIASLGISVSVHDEHEAMSGNAQTEASSVSEPSKEADVLSLEDRSLVPSLEGSTEMLVSTKIDAIIVQSDFQRLYNWVLNGINWRDNINRENIERAIVEYLLAYIDQGRKKAYDIATFVRDLTGYDMKSGMLFSYITPINLKLRNCPMEGMNCSVKKDTFGYLLQTHYSHADRRFIREVREALEARRAQAVAERIPEVEKTVESIQPEIVDSLEPVSPYCLEFGPARYTHDERECARNTLQILEILYTADKTGKGLVELTALARRIFGCESKTQEVFCLIADFEKRCGKQRENHCINFTKKGGVIKFFLLPIPEVFQGAFDRLMTHEFDESMKSQDVSDGGENAVGRSNATFLHVSVR